MVVAMQTEHNALPERPCSQCTRNAYSELEHFVRTFCPNVPLIVIYQNL